MRQSLWCALSVVLAALPSMTGAQERILAFDSQIVVDADASMEVTETIRVRAQAQRIRRGILRDFPTDYSDRLGNRYRVGFQVLSVERDGHAEPFRRERLGDGVRLRIGRADVFLDPGVYEYRIRYRTTRQIGYFGDYDELWWNVTGNGWDFAIDRASARVVLPASPPQTLGIEGFVGAYGSTERSVETSKDADGSVSVRATRILAPGEGLTFVATWPKGLVYEPTRAQQVALVLKDNRGLLAAVIGFFASLVYLIYAWAKVGRDPAPGVIFPQYEPPERFSPASVRYVSRMNYDNKAFTAAVINLAVKGYIEISEDDDEYTLRRLPDGKKPLAPGESALLESLFREGQSVLLDNKNHTIINRARKAHARSLKRDYYKIYFVGNAMVILPAVLVLVLAFVAALLMVAITPATVIVFALGLVVMFVFLYLMRAPTQLGRRMLDKIEGFKLYLDVAEKDELDLRNPPDKTPELFELFLPFALALGVEQRWAEKFAGVFNRASAGGEAYRPVWYSGYWNPGGLGNNVGRLTSMTSSLGKAIASSSHAPGSSSGAGGGGFSGGGGGGGGGGGW